MSGDRLITVEEEEAVRQTWGLVAKDLKGNGVKFFIHFFTEFPEYQKIFRGFADVPLDQLAENKRLKAHGFTVLTSINGLVENLDDPEILTELLVKTGQNHIKRKLKIGDFQNVTQSLMAFMEKSLGDVWTPVARSGWEKVMSFMGSKIGEGLENPE